MGPPSSPKSAARTSLRRKRATSKPSSEHSDEAKHVTGLGCPDEEQPRYQNLDEILASFGAWNPFYRHLIVFSCLFWLTTAMSYGLVGVLRDCALTPVGKTTVYCQCVHDKHAVHQDTIRSTFPKLADWTDPDEDAKAYESASEWGYFLGLGLLFLANIWGRRLVIGVSAMITGISVLSIYWLAQHSVYHTRMAVLVSTATVTLVDFTTLVNMIEWVPSAARPLAIFGQLSCYYFSTVLNSFIVRYSYTFTPYLLIIYAGVVFIMGVGVLIFHRDSPYYYLMRHDIDNLHLGILSIARHRKTELSPEEELAVEDAIDDVAFVVFEGNDTMVDAAIRMFSNLKVVRSLMIIMAVQTVHSSIGSFINVQKLGFFTWGIFEMPIRNAIYNCGGLLLAFMLLGRRRALTITMSFVSSGFLLVLIYGLIGDYSYDTCTSSYVSRDAVGYMILVLMLLAEMSKRAGVMTSMLYTIEYFPTSIRPICISLQYATITSFGALFKMLSEIVLRYGLHWQRLLPIIMCALMAGGSLFLHKKPFNLSAWYADLEPEKKHKELEAFPKPMLIKKTREKKKDDSIQTD